MKKFLTSICLLIFATGFAVASVDFLSPEKGMTYSGDEIFISWENGNYSTSNLMYSDEKCTGSLPGNIILKDIIYKGNYTWDIPNLDTEEYCIKIADDMKIHNEVSITIDREKPLAEFLGTPYFGKVNENISLQANLYDNTSLASYELDFGDGVVDMENITGMPKQIQITKTHSYDATGKYTVTLKVTDSAGNTETEKTPVVVIDKTPDWMIQLSADKPNLISIPFLPEDSDYDEVLEGIEGNVDRIWSYEYDESKKQNEWRYKQRSGSKWTGSTDFKKIVPGRGYFVFMDDDDVLYGFKKMGFGNANEEPALPSEVKLANGYNLIGLFGKNATALWPALGSLRNMAGKPYWYKVSDIDGQEITALMPEKGYWISMKHLPDSAVEDYYSYYP